MNASSSRTAIWNWLPGTGGRARQDAIGKVRAIERVMGMIEFDLDGRVLAANANFLEALGYTLEEVLGQHHRMFVEPGYAQSAEYRQFWEKLARGDFDAGQYKRLGKGGREVWIQASYNPVLDASGRPVKVVKFATDITEQKRRAADHQGQMQAIDRVMGVIEFDLEGRVLSANSNFLAVLGYTLDEVVGRHHRMFVEPGYAQSAEYRQFWEKLARGEFDAGQYKRHGKAGRVVWIQASYNPILDASGRPVKVVKYATDITEQKRRAADSEGQMKAIDRVMGVIEFDLEGQVLSANDNFLNLLGYRLDEVRGRHHRQFVEPAVAQGQEYRQFWDKLARGQYDAGRYRRLGKGGREVWIQASYNPILDASGVPVKVVKYATDITEQVRAEQAMTAVVTQVTGIAEQVDCAAREISSGNSNLSARTESQAASVEETASSMEELASAVRQNSENAARASQLATASAATAERGHTVIGQMVATMEDIRQATARIADIIGVIDGIAFQTNILALNAAVEAARAGNEGRGFAVVAGEVRNLAQRCAASAKEIRGLIATAGEKVDGGAGLADQAGQTMKELLAAVSSVNDTIGEIAAASREQSAGIEQINTAIMSIDEGTQQNAALVEQIAAASRSLEEQAGGLVEVVGARQVADAPPALRRAA